MQDEVTHRFPERCATRLARHEHRPPLAAKPDGEEICLSALPRSVESPQRHEHPPPNLRIDARGRHGGPGSIGSHLVDALIARGDEVTVVDNFASGKRQNLNPAATLLEHDIREPFSLDADAIFHLAAQADVQTSMKRPTAAPRSTSSGP